MKKENRKLAQELRAKNRKKEERNRKLRIIIPILVVVVAAAALIVWIAVGADRSRTSSAASVSEGAVTAGSDRGETDSSAESAENSSGKGVLDTNEERVVQDGDTVNIDYVGSVDGVEFSGGSTNGQGADLTLGSGTYIPGFEEAIVGHHVGETFDLTVTFPEDYGAADLAGKEAVFKTTINGVYEE